MTPRRLTLIVGAGLILLANGVALTGVAYNRSGEPESRLTLSQRELSRPWAFYGNKENSGLSLSLNWRVATGERYPDYYSSHGGSPAWLDEKRIIDLGFDVARFKRNITRRNGDYAQLEHEVLVVLELAGPAWQQTLEPARQNLLSKESISQASPAVKELVQSEKQAREALAREENENTRLFAIDAGMDMETLRTQYPDRSRYLILKGKLRLHAVVRDSNQVVTGFLSDLSASQINVPHALRAVFEGMPSQSTVPAEKMPPFTATVAIGKRLEPWIEAVTTP